MIRAFAKLLVAAGALLALGSPGLARAPAVPASLWHGGTILTMEGDQPRTVEAVVERGGRIVFAGRLEQARRIAGRNAEDHDLAGKTLLPGFIDAHSHFALAMQLAGGIDLLDPAIDAPGDIPALLSTLQQQVAQRGIAPGGWVVVWRYDQDKLAEKRHITRAELDSALPDHKVVLLHFTMHGLVANSAALETFGVKEDSPVPAGGVMTRMADGRYSGLLFETAMYAYAGPKLPHPTAAERLAALDIAQQNYARAGYTHVQDGATQPADLAFLTSVEAKSRLKLDLALLPTWSQIDELSARTDVRFGSYDGRVKLQGIKFVLDGSPQARTAYMTRDYTLGSPGGDHPWHGQPVTSEADWLALARKAHARGWQLFVHANGDAAIDMAIRGFDALDITAADNRRPVVIHSQFQRADQLPAYVRIGVGPAYFTGHTHYFADIHRSNFPAEVVGFISPLRAARQSGLHPTNHTDFPVTPLDPMMMIWSAMARQSLNGTVNGADQRVTAYEALQAITGDAAWQVFEEGRKGRISKGLLADFVVLDRNPLQTPLADIRAIRVMETVKEGRSVWRRD